MNNETRGAVKNVPNQECDIVMKGGITSGVVYPGVLFKLAKKYRFRSIGGASAGAIAAGAAAAAEYGRQNGNDAAFDQLNALSDDLSTGLLGLFQPAEKTAPLFNVLITALGSHEDKVSLVLGVAGELVRPYWGYTLLGLAPAVAVLALGFVTSSFGWPLLLATALLGVLGVAATVGWRSLRTLTQELPNNGFGVCNGAATGDEPALTEWLHAQIQSLAGRGVDDAPLTFGDLFGEGGRAAPNIELQVMTTSLTHQRPFQIPFESREFSYSPDEFAALFPEAVVQHMAAHARGNGDGLQWLPQPEEFPIVVAVRMSLSFPALLSAVPLYARDFSHNTDAGRNKLRRVWMSDGGICSNFPIHFFDSVWPSRPTFGINLTTYDEDVHRDGRVYLPPTGAAGSKRPFVDFDDMIGFGWSIITTMQDWRDTVQTVLPGYRERIVQVALEGDEGGLNLTMPPQLIERLAGYGSEAGDALVDEFDFAAHRWRRHLMWMACLERLLEQGHNRYGESTSTQRAIAIDETLPWHDRALAMGLAEFIDEYDDKPDRHHGTHENAAEDLARLMELAEKWLPVAKYDADGKMANVPRPPVDFRLTPSEKLRIPRT